MHLTARRHAIAAAVLFAFAPDVQGQSAPGDTTRGAGARSRDSVEATRPVLRAVRREGPVVLDGRLGEAAWERAPVGTDFTQSYPNPGQRAPDQTQVRVLYDDHALYVGVRMLDPRPDSIAAQLARRDASGIYSDWVHVTIDSYNDRRTGFRFSVNPKQVLKDVYHFNDNNEDINWDAVWEAATAIDSLGWVAEYRIPFSQLRFGSMPAGVERTWGFQVQRDVARRNQRDSFSPWTPDGRGYVSRSGYLVGIAGIPVPRRLEVLPYVSASATRAPGDEADPFYESTDYKPSAGADVRWGMPGGLTLTATVNPDFGQVEVDPAVVNLSAFETFFPEKRPFFLEGSDVFEFGEVRRQNDYGGQTFLYSRRIGRAPQRFAGGRFIDYVDAPSQTTILGAAKVTGKVGRWTIGILDAVTDEEEARVDSAGAGPIAKTPVEPRTNYFAARARRDFRNGQTVVGLMGTHVARDLDASGPDPDLFDDFLTSRAIFGGLDFEHNWDNRKWWLSGFTALSTIAGSDSAIARQQRNPARYYTRPDADHLDYDPTRTTLTGHFSEIAIQRTGDLFGSIAIKHASPGFEINDFGFHGRMDYGAYSDLIGIQTFREGRIFRDKVAYVYQNHAWNGDGDAIYHGFAGSAQGTFKSFWYGSVRASFSPRSYDDRLTRGGPLSINPRSWNVGASFGSDGRKPLVVNGYTEYGRDDAGFTFQYVELGFTLRPSTSVLVRFSPNVNIGRDQTQYVQRVSDATATDTYLNRYVFSDLDQVTTSLDTRIEWTLTPTLSLQTYIQPFVSAGDYKRFKELERPGSFDFAVYGRDRGTIVRDQASGNYVVDPDGPDGPAARFTIGNPTFNVRSLRGNAVMRWEYRPGSTLFLVWQQERSGFEPIGGVEGARDLRRLLSDDVTNVFLIKATYWLNR